MSKMENKETSPKCINSGHEAPLVSLTKLASVDIPGTFMQAEIEDKIHP